MGDELALTVELNREDVEVAYQWQKMYTGKPEAFDTALADYAEDEPTWYSWPLVNREDVEVAYQWQKMYTGKPEAFDTALADYAEDEPTWYSWPLEDKSEQAGSV